MTPREVHYAFKLGMDRVDSASSEDFNVAEIDFIVNQAQLLFIKQRYDKLSNRKQLGFEASQKRIDDLASIHVQYPLQAALTPTLLDGVYELPLSSLTYPYLFLTSSTAVVTDSSCDYEVPLKATQTDDLSEVLRDPFNSPSLDFVPYNLGRSESAGVSMFIYPGNLAVKKVKVSYITNPPRFSIGNYTYEDGSPSNYQPLVTPEQTHQEIVDLACQIASYNIESPEYIQLKNQKILIQE